MRKVIERFAFDRPAEAQALDAEGFKLFAGIDGGRADLAPFGKVVYAASDRVDEDPEHPGQIQAVQGALTQVSGGPVQKIDDWGTWRQAVQAEQPSMLVLLPHNTINPLIQTVHGLEISTEQTRWYTDLRDQDVHDPQAASRPLVLLLGCETMSTDIPYRSFVAKFLSLETAIVLSTTTSGAGLPRRAGGLPGVADPAGDDRRKPGRRRRPSARPCCGCGGSPCWRVTRWC